MRCLLCSAALLCFQLNFTSNSTLNLCRACFLTAQPYLLRSIWRGTCPVCKRCLSHNERSAFITTESDFKRTEKGSAAVTVLPFNSFPLSCLHSNISLTFSILSTHSARACTAQIFICAYLSFLEMYIVFSIRCAAIIFQRETNQFDLGRLRRNDA